jgi:hypothetical protein
VSPGPAQNPQPTVPSGRTSGRSHVTGRAQHRIDQVPVAIDRPKQIAPGAHAALAPRQKTATGIEGPDSLRRSQRRESSIFRLWTANLTHCGGYTTHGNGVWRPTGRLLHKILHLRHRDVQKLMGAMTDDVACSFRRARRAGAVSRCTITRFRDPRGLRTPQPVLRCSQNNRTKRLVH